MSKVCQIFTKYITINCVKTMSNLCCSQFTLCQKCVKSLVLYIMSKLCQIKSLVLYIMSKVCQIFTKYITINCVKTMSNLCCSQFTLCQKCVKSLVLYIMSKVCQIFTEYITVSKLCQIFAAHNSHFVKSVSNLWCYTSCQKYVKFSLNT